MSYQDRQSYQDRPTSFPRSRARVKTFPENRRVVGETYTFQHHVLPEASGPLLFAWHQQLARERAAALDSVTPDSPAHQPAQS